MNKHNDSIYKGVAVAPCAPLLTRALDFLDPLKLDKNIAFFYLHFILSLIQVFELIYKKMQTDHTFNANLNLKPKL